MKKAALVLFILLTILCIHFIESVGVKIFFSFILFGWFLFLDAFAQEKIFSTEWINALLGHLASMMCLLPYYQWKTMQKHRENTVALKKKWPPPFNVVIYSMKNFWNIKRLWNLYPDKLLRKKFILSILAMNTMLLGIIPHVPHFWKNFGPSYLVFLILAELYLQKFTAVSQRTSSGL